MGQIDIGSGGTTGKKPPKKKPPSINSLMTTSHTTSTPHFVSSYTPPQPVIHSSVVRRDPGPYSVADTAWGASGFKNSTRLAPIISRLRQKMNDEPELNQILSQLMQDRYDTFQDRLDAKYDHQRATYQRQLDEALDAQREGLPYDIPDKPSTGRIKRGQGITNLLETLSESIKPGMDQETKDAYSKFYKYELERLLDYKGDIRNQRNSLNSYYDNYINESQLIDTRENNDESSNGSDSDSGSGGSSHSSSRSGAVGNSAVRTDTSNVQVDPNSKWAGLLPSSDPRNNDNSGTGTIGMLAEKGERINNPKQPGMLDKLQAASPISHIPILKDVNAALYKVLDETADPLMWTMDKLSRPLYAVNNAALAYYGEDEDPEKTGFWDIQGVGKSPFDSLDDMDWSSLKEIGSEAWQGFTGKDKTTFGQIIARNAEADQVSDVRDNNTYQTLMGLVGDIALDPLNLVGTGIVTKPVKLVQGTQDISKLRTISKDAAELLNSAKPVYGPAEKPVTASEIFDLMTGKGVKVTSTAQKSQNIAQTNARVERIFRRLNDMEPTANTDGLVQMRDVASVLHAQREAVLKDFQGQTVVEALRRDLKIKVQRGSEPVDALDEFDDMLRTSYLVPKIAEARYFHQYLEKAAREQFNTTPSFETKVVPRKGSRTVAQSNLITGRTENVNVPVGGTKTVKGKMTSSAWENVGKRYDNLVELAKQGHIDKKEVEEFGNRIQKVLDEAPAKSLEELLPELARDYRFTSEQINGLYKESEKLAFDNAHFKRLSEESRAIWTQHIKGKNPNSPNVMAAITRRDFVNRQKDRIQASVMVKVLKSYAGKQPIYKDADRVAEIRAEIRRIERNKEVSGSTGHDIEDAEKLTSLRDELKSLTGVEASSGRRAIGDVPPAVGKVNSATGEVTYSESKLRSLIRVNRKSGEATYNTFRIGKTKDMTAEDHAWLNEVREILQEQYNPIFDARYKPASRMMREIQQQGVKPNQKDWAKFNSMVAEAQKYAEDEAFKYISREIELGRLSKADYSDEISLKRPLNVFSSEQELLDALKFKFGEKEAALKAERYAAVRTKQDAEVKRIDGLLEGLRVKHSEELARQKEIVAEAQKAKGLMAKRLREEAVLYAARLAIPASKKQLSLRILGADLAIPHSDLLFKGVEEISGLPLIKETRQAFADAFKSPSFRLPEELQYARAQALARTPIIIEHHINQLKATLGQIPERERIRAFDSILKGKGALLGEEPTQDAIRSAFEPLLPWFNRGQVVGEHPVTVADINKYLSEEFKLSEEYVNRSGGIDTVQKLINSIRYKKSTNKADRSLLRDPYRISWNLRVATEQAAAVAAVKHVVTSTFGVKDLHYLKHGNPEDISYLTKELRDLGWKKIDRLGNDHWFPSEVVPDVHRLLDLMEPRNLSEFGRMADRATGYWKTITTVYNPGYWTRNGIGEVMSSWFAGLSNPRWYKSAGDTIKYARGDGQELEALKSQFAMLNFMPSESVKGNRVALNLSDGTPITHEQVWVAYNDQGLKTGFINTEFDEQYSRLGNAFRQAPVGQQMANAHTKLRTTGEWYEDYLRMAHFQFAMRKSGAKTLEGAAKFAAAEVRKYHFDYTDFTNFEKTVMLRAFPFYKWTRKALPLMTTMLFTKPGKVMAYPKVMNAAQNTLTSNDIAGDDNGFAPNYEGIVPGWIQDLFAYQIAGDQEEGDQTWFNVNTPQMDIYKNITSPGSTAYGLLNPLIKAPAEQLQGFFADESQGHTLANLFRQADFPTDRDENGHPDTNMNIPLNTNDDKEGSSRLAELMRMTPQGNFLQKLGLNEGKMDQGSLEDLLAFATGLGIYENNDKRRMGEQISRGY